MDDCEAVGNGRLWKMKSAFNGGGGAFDGSVSIQWHLKATWP